MRYQSTRDRYLLDQRTALRFWSRVLKHGPVPEHRPDLGPCWLRQASLNAGGYGQFHVRFNDGRWAPVGAHRVAYQLAVGPIPDGSEPDHLCRNRACVKAIADGAGPAHLEIVTQRENILRGNGWSGRHARKTHCPRGHPYDERNTYRDKKGQRHCRSCHAARERRRRE